MSVLNNLKKPTFSKAVMGYTPAEVDRYIEHINERYSTVSREATELKRRIIALQLRLDEANAELDAVKKEAYTKKVLDRDAISALFALLEREKTRHNDFLDVMKDKLSEMFADSIEKDEDSDEEWTDVLEDFISLPSHADKAEDAILAEVDDSIENDIFYNAVKNAVLNEAAPVNAPQEVADAEIPCDETATVQNPPYRAVFTFDDVSAEKCDTSDDTEVDEISEDVEENTSSAEDDSDFLPSDETDPQEWDFDTIIKMCSVAEKVKAEAGIPDEPVITGEKEDVDFSALHGDEETNEVGEVAESAEAAVAEAEKEEDTRSPAEIAAELDFYQDGEHTDGESFDPMTLAHRATAQRSRPSLEDFLRTRDGGKKK